jgi:Carboxypeptidase regulatory-like domain/TonB-dependent Receptor Plug Domain
MRNGRFLLGVLLLLAAAFSAGAQTTTGVISGRVVDPSGLGITGATVILTNEATGAPRQTLSTDSGDFVFPSILPGRYTVAVQAAGMKRLEQRNINVSSSERLALGDLALEIGAVTESVQITAQGTPVQTQSQERSAILTTDQMATLASRSRDFLSLTRVLPGVVSEPPTGLGTSDIIGITQGPKVSGLRGEFNTYSVDGLFLNDLGTRDTLYNPVNMDAVSEVKVLLSNYQAEYGRAGGAIISAVTKSGSQQFHGSGYVYKRHEQFNANTFFNNLNNVPKARYRYTTGGVSLGGPIVWPGKFNSGRDKLFFFYSNETLRGETPQGLIQQTMPTALERAGDFSQSLDTNGVRINVRDPLANAAFPNNVIPTSRINSNGQKLLQLFPMPNQLDRSITRGNYNYNFQESIAHQKQNNTFRIDGNASSAVRMYFRGNSWRESNQGHRLGGCQPGPAWGFLPCDAAYRDIAGVFNLTWVMRPTLVHEFSAAAHHPVEFSPPRDPEDLNRLNRAKLGINLPQFYPQHNWFNLIPYATFGGIPNAARLRTDDRFPKRGYDTSITFSDSVSWIRGPHTFKFGFYSERQRTNDFGSSLYAGDFDFTRDVNNPGDTNHTYANALVGSFLSYSESDTRLGPAQRLGLFEWYAQDNWKVNRKLTLDYGVRWSYFTPIYNLGRGAYFDPDKYNPARRSLLFEPALNPQGQRAARNPLTGQFFPVPYIGAIVPNSGDLTNGTVVEGAQGYERYFVINPGIAWGPRFGFAYDPFGDGRTAIRGGAGIMYDRTGPAGSNANPPQRFTQTIYYGTMDNYINTAGVISPFSTTSADRAIELPTVYHLSLGVQRDIGHQTVLDVAYVSTLGRHLDQTVDLNAIPYGARFQPQNQDPTTGRPLIDNFFRPYRPYTTITYREHAGTSNYHSLQVQGNRRFSRGLQFGAAWTWSKTMDYSSETGAVAWARFAPRRDWNYGKALFDRTHILALNWQWDVPRASTLANNGFVRAVFDNWQVSGIATFSSGGPFPILLTTADNADLTGGGDGARPIVLSNANLPKDQRTVARYFNPDVFGRPARGDRGNAPKDVVRGPGQNNFDFSFFKEIPVKERARFTFRWELYNAFNHTQFLNLDNTARFDAAGRQVNTRFGALIANRDSRRMQASLRFTF